MRGSQNYYHNLSSNPISNPYLNSVLPYTFKNIIGPFWGINNINPTAMFDINSISGNYNLPMFRVRGKGIGGTSSVTLSSYDGNQLV
jgi:hypothetical protein